MPRRPATALLLLLAAGATACAGAPRCATAPAGAVVRWADLSLDPATRITVVPVLVQAPADFDPSAGTVLVLSLIHI